MGVVYSINNLYYYNDKKNKTITTYDFLDYYSEENDLTNLKLTLTNEEFNNFYSLKKRNIHENKQLIRSSGKIPKVITKQNISYFLV